MIEALYDAAARSGLLTVARIGGVDVFVDFRSPDEDVLGGLAMSRQLSIRFPVTRCPNLAAGDHIAIRGQSYQVREVTHLGDGAEACANLTRL
jgi:hypothetical protein